MAAPAAPTPTLETVASLDAWSAAVPRLSCPALHAQLSAIHGACNAALLGGGAADALSPMLDPVSVVLAQARAYAAHDHPSAIVPAITRSLESLASVAHSRAIAAQGRAAGSGGEPVGGGGGGGGSPAFPDLPAAAALRLPALADICARFAGVSPDEAAGVFATLALRLSEAQRVTVGGASGATGAAAPAAAALLDPTCGEPIGGGLLHLCHAMAVLEPAGGWRPVSDVAATPARSTPGAPPAAVLLQPASHPAHRPVTVAALCLALDVLLRGACPALHARMAALGVPVAAFSLGWVSTLGLGGGEAPPLVTQASGVRWVLLQCLTHGWVGWLRAAGAACALLADDALASSGRDGFLSSLRLPPRLGVVTAARLEAAAELGAGLSMDAAASALLLATARLRQAVPRGDCDALLPGWDADACVSDIYAEALGAATGFALRTGVVPPPTGGCDGYANACADALRCLAAGAAPSSGANHLPPHGANPLGSAVIGAICHPTPVTVSLAAAMAAAASSAGSSDASQPADAASSSSASSSMSHAAASLPSLEPAPLEVPHLAVQPAVVELLRALWAHPDHDDHHPPLDHEQGEGSSAAPAAAVVAASMPTTPARKQEAAPVQQPPPPPPPPPPAATAPALLTEAAAAAAAAAAAGHSPAASPGDSASVASTATALDSAGGADSADDDVMGSPSGTSILGDLSPVTPKQVGRGAAGSAAHHHHDEEAGEEDAAASGAYASSVAMSLLLLPASPPGAMQSHSPQPPTSARSRARSIIPLTIAEADDESEDEGEAGQSADDGAGGAAAATATASTAVRPPLPAHIALPVVSPPPKPPSLGSVVLLPAAAPRSQPPPPPPQPHVAAFAPVPVQPRAGSLELALAPPAVAPAATRHAEVEAAAEAPIRALAHASEDELPPPSSSQLAPSEQLSSSLSRSLYYGPGVEAAVAAMASPGKGEHHAGGSSTDDGSGGGGGTLFDASSLFAASTAAAAAAASVYEDVFPEEQLQHSHFHAHVGSSSYGGDGEAGGGGGGGAFLPTASLASPAVRQRRDILTSLVVPRTGPLVDPIHLPLAVLTPVPMSYSKAQLVADLAASQRALAHAELPYAPLAAPLGLSLSDVAGMGSRLGGTLGGSHSVAADGGGSGISAAEVASQLSHALAASHGGPGASQRAPLSPGVMMSATRSAVETALSESLARVTSLVDALEARSAQQEQQREQQEQQREQQREQAGLANPTVVSLAGGDDVAAAQMRATPTKGAAALQWQPQHSYLVEGSSAAAAPQSPDSPASLPPYQPPRGGGGVQATPDAARAAPYAAVTARSRAPLSAISAAVAGLYTTLSPQRVEPPPLVVAEAYLSPHHFLSPLRTVASGPAGPASTSALSSATSWSLDAHSALPLEGGPTWSHVAAAASGALASVMALSSGGPGASAALRRAGAVAVSPGGGGALASRLSLGMGSPAAPPHQQQQQQQQQQLAAASALLPPPSPHMPYGTLSAVADTLPPASPAAASLGSRQPGLLAQSLPPQHSLATLRRGSLQAPNFGDSSLAAHAPGFAHAYAFSPGGAAANSSSSSGGGSMALEGFLDAAPPSPCPPAAPAASPAATRREAPGDGLPELPPEMRAALARLKRKAAQHHALASPPSAPPPPGTGPLGLLAGSTDAALLAMSSSLSELEVA